MISKADYNNETSGKQSLVYFQFDVPEKVIKSAALGWMSISDVFIHFYSFLYPLYVPLLIYSFVITFVLKMLGHLNEKHGG